MDRKVYKLKKDVENDELDILKKLKRKMYESKIKIIIKKVKKRNKRDKMSPSKLIEYFDINSLDELDGLMDYMENNPESENVKFLQDLLEEVEIDE